MEKGSAEGPVLLFVQTHEWKFKLSRTSIAGAFPLLSGSCVLIQAQLLGEWFPCLSPGYSCPFPLAHSSHTLERLATFNRLAYLYPRLAKVQVPLQ